MKTVVQSDFDGTITEEDVSYLILDTYVGDKWRELLREYTAGRISVGAFNTGVFAMVRAGEKELVDLVLNSERVRIRPGFRELLDYCAGKGYRFVITSNGLEFYIGAILKKLGINHIDYYAGKSRFAPEGMDVKYLGPDGNRIETGIKEAYTELLQQDGARIVYLGNGVSDIYPARRAAHVFATGDLLQKCREENLACHPFDDMHDIVRGLASLELD